MAITSSGYPDLIPPGATFALMQMVLGRQYMAATASGCSVSKVAGGTRQSRISAGYLGGKGILDYSDAPETVTHDAVPSGIRYDAIVLRRWVDNTAVDPDVPFRSEFKVVKGTAARAIPLLTQNPGTLDDQAIALVGHRAGETESFEIVDLRCIAEEPGVYTIYDDLALQLIKRPGIQAYNANTNVTYRCVFLKNGSLDWQRVSTKPGALIGVYEGEFYPLSAPAGGGSGYRVWGMTPQDIAFVNIPDPGVPYRVEFEAYGEMGSEASNARWDFHGRIGSARLALYATQGANGLYLGMGFRHVLGIPSAQVFTGANAAYLTAYKVGTGGSDYGAITTSNRKISVAVYEA